MRPRTQARPTARPRRASVSLAAVLSLAFSACSSSRGGASGAGGDTRSGGGDGGSSLGSGSGAGRSSAGGGGGASTDREGGASGRSAAAGGASGAPSGGLLGTEGLSVEGGRMGGGAGSGAGGSSGGSSAESNGSGGSRAGGSGAGGSRAGGTGAGGSGAGGAGAATQRPISFGTLLDPQTVMQAAQQLAKSLATPGSAGWQAKGDQHRTYRFAEANVDEPYRLCVPTTWDGTSKLPLVMFLHGAGNDESSYLDQNNKQMVTLAQSHGVVLVSPLGYTGAYGNFLRLTAPFGDEADAAKLMAQVTADSERTNELSEKDVLNVLELVLNEYPIDRSAVFLTGHSMGSGGTWYIGGKYPAYWKAIAPMSGPFVQESGYPWEGLRGTAIFVTEGTQAPSASASRLLRDWLQKNGFKSEYEEVNADHPGMVKLVLPDVFDFFDRSRAP